MLRGALGVFDALLRGGALPRQIIRETSAKQIWTRGISTRAVPVATPWHHRTGAFQLWARNMAGPKGSWKQGRFRATVGLPKRSFHTSKPRRTTQQAAEGAQKEAEPTTLSARLKKLTREYGWVSVGVYFGLSVLDFPFCFLIVRMVGTERISAAEHYVLSHIEAVVPQSVQTFWHNYRQALKDAEKEQLGDNQISEDVEMVGWGVKEAEEKNKSEASLATQLALAYAIHKSFIFIRVPLAAAVTPKMVKILRGWGWKIGKSKAKR